MNNTSDTIYQVLFTHQKRKKAKVWQDGFLRIPMNGQKAFLLDESKKCLDSIYVKKRVLVGENLESEKYLIDVESEIQQAVNLEGEKQSIPSSVVLNKNEGYASVGIKKNILSSRTGFGLKRKHGGFLPPRQVKPRRNDEENLGKMEAPPSTNPFRPLQENIKRNSYDTNKTTLTNQHFFTTYTTPERCDTAEKVPQTLHQALPTKTSINLGVSYGPNEFTLNHSMKKYDESSLKDSHHLAGGSDVQQRTTGDVSLPHVTNNDHITVTDETRHKILEYTKEKKQHETSSKSTVISTEGPNSLGKKRNKLQILSLIGQKTKMQLERNMLVSEKNTLFLPNNVQQPTSNTSITNQSVDCDKENAFIDNNTDLKRLVPAAEVQYYNNEVGLTNDLEESEKKLYEKHLGCFDIDFSPFTSEDEEEEKGNNPETDRKLTESCPNQILSKQAIESPRTLSKISVEINTKKISVVCSANMEQDHNPITNVDSYNTGSEITSKISDIITPSSDNHNNNEMNEVVAAGRVDYCLNECERECKSEPPIQSFSDNSEIDLASSLPGVTGQSQVNKTAYVTDGANLSIDLPVKQENNDPPTSQNISSHDISGDGCHISDTMVKENCQVKSTTNHINDCNKRLHNCNSENKLLDKLLGDSGSETVDKEQQNHLLTKNDLYSFEQTPPNLCCVNTTSKCKVSPNHGESMTPDVDLCSSTETVNVLNTDHNAKNISLHQSSPHLTPNLSPFSLTHSVMQCKETKSSKISPAVCDSKTANKTSIADCESENDIISSNGLFVTSSGEQSNKNVYYTENDSLIFDKGSQDASDTNYLKKCIRHSPDVLLFRATEATKLSTECLSSDSTTKLPLENNSISQEYTLSRRSAFHGTDSQTSTSGVTSVDTMDLVGSSQTTISGKTSIDTLDMSPSNSQFTNEDSPELIVPQQSAKYTEKQQPSNSVISFGSFIEESDSKKLESSCSTAVPVSKSFSNSKVLFSNTDRPSWLNESLDDISFLYSSSEENTNEDSNENYSSNQPNLKLSNPDVRSDACSEYAETDGCDIPNYKSKWQKFSEPNELNLPTSHGIDHLACIAPGKVDTFTRQTYNDSNVTSRTDTSTVRKLTNEYLDRMESTSSHSNLNNAMCSNPIRNFKPPRSMKPLSTSTNDSWHIPTESSAAGLPRGQRPTHNAPMRKDVNNPGPYNKSLLGDLQFPNQQDVDIIEIPLRKAVIPATFSSIQNYKQSLTSALIEHINILLWDVAKRYYSSLGNIDVSAYSETEGTTAFAQSEETKQSCNPLCEHGNASKIIQVKKEGKNKGRFFFTCNAQRGQQCKFFKWADQIKEPAAGGKMKHSAKLTLTDASSIATYFKGQQIMLYCECLLLRKSRGSFSQGEKSIPPWVRKKFGAAQEQEECVKKITCLKLNQKTSSAAHSKDDLWIISHSLNFSKSETFLAKSTYFGPRANNELEIEPSSGFSPSLWPSNVVCHAINAGNLSSELMCLSNIEEFLTFQLLPILPHLLDKTCSVQNTEKIQQRRSFTAPTYHTKQIIHVPSQFIMHEMEEFANHYHLNKHQHEALREVAEFLPESMDSGSKTTPFTLIHGVFGAGKSYLLAVIVLFIVHIFEMNDQYTPGVPTMLRLLISSTTNVAVDRILLGLQALGFSDFVRVGSVRKIAKPILPHSIHGLGSDSKEIKELQEMAKSDISQAEKVLVRKTIEQWKKGKNKKMLNQVHVVGVTCAACTFPCLKDMEFQIVLLDECSQMTEPVSLLPIARFTCHRLVLVGDPKQLSPTIQGSEAVHLQGLEQTLFDRLTKMGHQPIMLRTQYRCHPTISTLSNNLFYDRQLEDGVTAAERLPLAKGWPTLTFFDVSLGKEESDHTGSYYNQEEASCIVRLIEGLFLDGIDSQDIGVISLYKAQLGCLSAKMQDSSTGHDFLKDIQMSTVDAFQGGEKGVIFLSCVRTRQVGFIDSDKRVNVALTRAKNHLFILGSQKHLTQNDLWSKVIMYCAGEKKGLQKSTVFLKEMKNWLASKQDTEGVFDDNTTENQMAADEMNQVVEINDTDTEEVVICNSSQPSVGDSQAATVDSELNTNQNSNVSDANNDSNRYRNKRIKLEQLYKDICEDNVKDNSISDCTSQL